MKGFSEIKILKMWSNRDLKIRGGNRNFPFVYKWLPLVTLSDQVQVYI